MSDIKLGIPIVLQTQHGEGRILVVPVERINISLFDKLKSLFSNLSLIITEQRMDFLHLGKREEKSIVRI
ncbi:hypothetical protein [Candidatus Bandiella euplotis]|nr:hypothetical protein [Candidatus Bandiella woodruffii]